MFKARFAALSEFVLAPAAGPAADASSAEVISVILANTLLSSACTISTSWVPSFWANRLAMFLRINSKIFPSLSLNSIFKSSSSKEVLNFVPLGTSITRDLSITKPSTENVFLPLTSTNFDKSRFCPYLFIDIIS